MLVVGLALQDVEALHDGQAGVDHRREEAREGDDVLRGRRRVPIWKLSALPFFLTFVGWSCCARRRWLTASSDSASIAPLRTSPVRARLPIRIRPSSSSTPGYKVYKVATQTRVKV